jgi:hypothetical protein
MNSNGICIKIKFKKEKSQLFGLQYSEGPGRRREVSTGRKILTTHTTLQKNGIWEMVNHRPELDNELLVLTVYNIRDKHLPTNQPTSKSSRINK